MSLPFTAGRRRFAYTCPRIDASSQNMRDVKVFGIISRTSVSLPALRRYRGFSKLRGGQAKKTHQR